MKSFTRKIIAILVSVIVLFPIMGNTVYATVEIVKPLVTGNDFVEYTINQNNGRFSIRTNEGSPWREDDGDKQLLYLNKIPETSFTTFRIDGEDYIYGNSYGFLGGDGNFISNASIRQDYFGIS